MRCYICNSTISSDDIKFKAKYGHGGIDPCGACMEKINEVFEPLSEEALDFVLEDTDVELLSDEDILLIE